MRTSRRRKAAALIALAVLLAATALGAHPLAPALLDVTLTDDGLADVVWRLPLAVAAQAALEPRLPASCVALDGPAVSSIDGGARTTRWRVRCGDWSPGDTIAVRGLELVDTDVLVRIRLAGGRLARAVLSARQPVFTIPPRATWAAVFGDYFGLGVAHLLGAADHLAFLVGLLLLVLRAGAGSPLRRLAGTVTAFTLGHSVSLSLAALGLVRVPSGPVEVAIALSIVALAVELAVEPEEGDRWPLRRPWRLAAAFGVLHGFGFAGALSEVGLPAGEIPAALLAFNCGLEAGQLAVVLVAVVPLGLLAGARPSRWYRLTRLAAYAGGVLAAFWAFERGAAWL